MEPDPDWEPSDSDVAWVENLIRTLKDGGVWGLPSSRSEWQFFKRAKLAVLLCGALEDETNRRTAAILRGLEWTVKEG